MKTFSQFLAESKQVQTEWVPINKLKDHVHSTAIKAVVKHPFYSTIMNQDLAHGGSGNLHHRVKTDKNGFMSVQVASTKKDKEGHLHHATFHLSTSGRKVSHGEWQKTKDNVTKTVRQFGYDE